MAPELKDPQKRLVELVEAQTRGPSEVQEWSVPAQAQHEQDVEVARRRSPGPTLVLQKQNHLVSKVGATSRCYGGQSKKVTCSRVGRSA